MTRDVTACGSVIGQRLDGPPRILATYHPRPQPNCDLLPDRNKTVIFYSNPSPAVSPLLSPLITHPSSAPH